MKKKFDIKYQDAEYILSRNSDCFIKNENGKTYELKNTIFLGIDDDSFVKEYDLMKGPEKEPEKPPQNNDNKKFLKLDNIIEYLNDKFC